MAANSCSQILFIRESVKQPSGYKKEKGITVVKKGCASHESRSVLQSGKENAVKW